MEPWLGIALLWLICHFFCTEHTTRKYQATTCHLTFRWMDGDYGYGEENGVCLMA